MNNKNSLCFHDWIDLEPPQRFADPPLVVQLDGDYACFTRPELSSERVSYSVMTPSAAEGLLSSIFWKPQFKWVIEKIEVLAPVRWMTFRRNESATPITREILDSGYLDVNEAVQQRMTTMLRDVSYRVHANVWVHPDAEEQNPAKWRDQFNRRLRRGQTFRQPYLGMREFHADVYPPDGRPPLDWTEDLGIMLHSIQTDWKRRKESYSWFVAGVEAGVLKVPRSGLALNVGGH